MSNLLKYGALSIAGLAAISALSLSVRKSDYANGKTVPLKCSCGKFSGSVTLPKKESQSAGMNVVCHCQDCFKWASQVVDHGGLTESQGDHILMVYRASVKIDTPELIRSMRLYDNTITHRYMTSCCGTAIAGVVSGSPIVGLSSSIVADKPALLARIGPKYNIRLKDRKHVEPFASDPNSFAEVPAWFFAKYVSFALQGLMDMMSPTAFPEDTTKEEVVFPGKH